MFKLRKRLDETDERIQVLEKRLEDYRKELIWEFEMQKKLTNEFELKATKDIKAINKKLNKKNKEV